MRSQDAKKIPMRELLARLGFEPAHEKSGDVWYISPFRPQEQKASLHCREQDNVWYDFGLGAGGNVLDFVMRYFQLPNVSSALHKLDDMSGWERSIAAGQSSVQVSGARSASSRALAAAASHESAGLVMVKLQPLQHWGLLDYVRKRGIDVGVARAQLQEIYYKTRANADRTYFALAFPNRTANGSEGYELRSSYFKGVIGQKDLSLIEPPQSEQAQASVAWVFEGCLDYCSYLTYIEKRQPDTAVIVLNSVALGERAISLIRERGIAEVHLCFDHDTAGRELTATFQKELEDRRVVDESAIYQGYKDFNEFIQQRRQQMRMML